MSWSDGGHHIILILMRYNTCMAWSGFWFITLYQVMYFNGCIPAEYLNTVPSCHTRDGQGDLLVGFSRTDDNSKTNHEAAQKFILSESQETDTALAIR
jgi:hypothetical protein